MTGAVILVDDEQHLRTACTQALELAGFSVDAFPGAESALDRISRSWDGVLITDIKMPGPDGLELMRRALDIDPELPVILVTGHGDVPMAVQAIRDGAYEFLEKPFASETLVDAARRACEKRRLVLENRALRAELAGTTQQGIVGRTEVMRRLREAIASLAATDADILVRGETGVGKELVARSLHELSPRSGGKFVAINCGALPDTIIESELFGHEPGAFTGATKQRIGKFEYGSGGTVFLDEVESMPMDLQIKLLRVLQERVVERLGSNEEIPVDVRIIAATKKDLRQASAEGAFREDLFYRLDILTLDVPPLRERPDDVPLLFHHFVAQAAARFRREPREVAPEVLTRLLPYHWPGNVRELQNAAIRFALGLDLEVGGSQPSGEATSPRRGLAEQVASMEKRIIAQALIHNDNSLKATYEALGVSRKTLYEKMRKYGLGQPDDG